MTQHVSWPSIENFHSLRREVLKYPQNLGDDLKVVYRAKVKVHGTNAGVRIDPDGTVSALSRTSVITSKSDNAGFASWVESRADDFRRLARNFTIVVFGEWCGPGIQKGVAVNGIPRKSFAVFGMRVPELDAIATKPEFLSDLLTGIAGVYVIPWYEDGQEFVVDWSTDTLHDVLESINEAVEKVESEDPWILSQFGISGVGEGLVFYPQGRGDSYKMFTSCVFKAKGEKHNTVSKTRPAQKDATTVEALVDFVDLVVTESRLEQGAEYAALHGSGVPHNPKDMSAFLKWIHEDLVKETTAELAASNLPHKDAYKACTNHARVWFINKSKKI